MFNLLYDFDGTLFDTDLAHSNAFKATFETFHLGHCPDYETIKGIKTVDVIAKYTPDTDKINAISAYKSAFYQNHLSFIKPFVNFKLLDLIKKNGHQQFIVSGGRRKSIEQLIQLHGIGHLFDGIIAAEDYQASKPNPEAFLLCISKYHLTGLIYGLEDSKQGIESVKRAGIKAIGVHNVQIKEMANQYYDDINVFLRSLIDS